MRNTRKITNFIHLFSSVSVQKRMNNEKFSLPRAECYFPEFTATELILENKITKDSNYV